MTSKEVLEYLRTCKYCKIVMGTDYENDDKYPTIYDIFNEEIEIIEKDLERLEELEKENERLKKDLEVLGILKGISGYMSVKFFVKHLTEEKWIKVKEWLINE